MLAWSTTSLLLSLFLGRAHICEALPPLNTHVGDGAIRPAQRQLTGRFLHITDIHPDPFYKTWSSTDSKGACHRGSGPAGLYGAETSGCDTPLSLVNATFDWIRDNIRDDIDFIIWTGDSARHDNDDKIPRNQSQVVEQNELIVSKFREVFARDDDDDTDPTNDFIIPIIPTFGNNDILPHNIFLEGPNRWTSKYLDIWRSFIPEEQRHQFHRGGWFFVEAIPNKLAIFSLNTLYFFSNNAGVDGCAMKSEPGYEHFEWLRIQLQILRERGMKAILIGHVPPARTQNKQSWEETCWQKYTLWLRQYRDVIVTSLFGHMNIDHFTLQDSADLSDDTLNGKMPGVMDAEISGFDGGEVSVMGASDYLIDLREEWATLPSPSKKHAKRKELSPSALDRIQDFLGLKKGKKGKGDEGYLEEIGGPWGERYSVSQVAASVVPNYFPTLRVFEYNITGLESLSSSPSFNAQRSMEYTKQDFAMDDEDFDNYDDVEVSKKKKKNKDKARKSKKHKFTIPKSPSRSAPPGPAYSPQSLTIIGYTQYFANLTHINNDFHEDQSRKHSFYTEHGDNADYGDGFGAQRWKDGKHSGRGKPKHGEPHPNEFEYEIEYQTFNESDAFKLEDLTVRSWINLARRIGSFKKKSKRAGLGWVTGDVDEFEATEMVGRDQVVDEIDYAHHDDDDEEEEEEEGIDYSDNEIDENIEDGDVDIEKKKKKKKGKKHKKGKKNHVWYTFVKRAFVGTMDPTDIRSQFGIMDAAEVTDSSALDKIPASQAEAILEEGPELEVLGDGEL